MRLKSSAIFAVLILLGSLVTAAGQKTGGYREIDKADEGAAAAAEFAVKDQSEKKEMT